MDYAKDAKKSGKLDAGEVIKEVKEWVVFVSTVALFFYALKSGSKMSC